MLVTGDVPPGLRPIRLAHLVERAVAATALDLGGATVLTEAATGAYVVTPVLAAAGGAERVVAVTRATRHGTVADVVAQTDALAAQLGVADRITVHEGRPTPEQLAAADVVTNSGHVRPIDAEVIAHLRRDAVVPLMFESWEIDLGRDDVDLAALRAAGIRFAGTNERHPAVDVFSYLGPMAVKLLADAAVATYRARVTLLCDNPFRPYLVDGLERSGAEVVAADRPSADVLDAHTDAVVVALRPRGEPVLDRADLELIARSSPAAIVAQFWGDVDREACHSVGIVCAPETAPRAGHMGVLPSAVGPEPIVRLQAGGLKVAELLRRDRSGWTDDERRYVDDC